MAMSRSEIKEKLNDVMRMATPSSEVDFDSLPETATLTSDVGLSSVGILYIVIAIEEFFGIRFDDVGFADFKTIGDVIDYIGKKMEE